MNPRYFKLLDGFTGKDILYKVDKDNILWYKSFGSNIWRRLDKNYTERSGRVYITEEDLMLEML